MPQVTQPIFTAGRIKSNVSLAKAERDRALIQYERTIQTAFTEVSNALIAHQRVREERVKQELLVAALSDRKRLAYLRYRGGVDTQLNALDADRDLFEAAKTRRVHWRMCGMTIALVCGGGANTCRTASIVTRRVHAVVGTL